MGVWEGEGWRLSCGVREGEGRRTQLNQAPPFPRASQEHLALLVLEGPPASL